MDLKIISFFLKQIYMSNRVGFQRYEEKIGKVS